MTPRQREVDDLTAVLEAGGTTVVALGPPGIGRTWLLHEVGRRLGERGVVIRRAAGAPEELGMPYAGLHQLLHHDVEHIDAALPTHLRNALLAALGYDAGPAPATLPVATATLALLRLRAGGRPLVLVVDDAQWLDEASASVLAFVSRRLAESPVSLLLAERERAATEVFRPHGRLVELAPLTDAEAGLLLDELEPVPLARVRLAVLATAAGNPLVLRELALAHAGDVEAERRLPAEPLRLTTALARLADADLGELPAATREALALLAVAGDDDLDAVGPDRLVAGPEVWQPARERRLVELDGERVRLRGPLARSAVFHHLSAAERRRAHATWAGLLEDRPEQVVGHRAGAAAGPDREVADALAAAARVADDRELHVTAVAAWERAAELSPDPGAARDRLLSGLRSATMAGHVATARRLAAEAIRRTPDAAGRGELGRGTGWLDALSGRLDAALSTLLDVAGQHADPPSDRVWSALSPAATAAYHLGRPSARRRVQDVLARVERRRGECGVAETGSGGPQVNDLWVRVGIGAVGGDEARARLWRAREGSDEASGTELGACAWLLDETPLAVELLERMQRGPAESDGQVLQTLGWALFEIGRWDEAAVRFEQALTVARTWGQTTIEAAVRAGLAQLAAGRGDRAGADAQAVTAMRTLDPSVSAAVAVRARHAQSLAALAAGDHTAAWLHASRLVTDGGRPEHFHASYYALADLAEAGVRSGRRDLGRRLVDEVVAAPGAPSSARIRQLHGHAQALLAADTGTPGSAEEWFTRTAGDVRGETWPFERARLRLSHGRWLRRERRIAEAREPLELAAATFSRLGAAPWLAATQQELRATGVLRTESSTRLGALTPTEREIVRLAASGLTNRDIGERLFLSPRTVGSHLYRIFPKLGVTARNQLRDVLEP